MPVKLPPQFYRLPPVPIEILFLTDHTGCYEPFEVDFPPTGFQRSLHALVNALHTHPDLDVHVKRAHRLSGTPFSVTADDGLEGFKVTDSTLASAEELWLFGIGSANQAPKPLDANEIAAVDKYMKKNRGVFATGDHEDLGAPMCGGLPRIKSMRKWGGGSTPLVGGGARHDTRIKPAGEDPNVFDNEQANEHEYNDDVPQTLTVAINHPLLSSSEGAINVMPDHMHEGSCIVPNPLPAEFGAIAPQVIASGANHALNAVEATFGVIGVYDGESKTLGRTVVQSTWHHFVWLNQQGYFNSQTTEGKRAWRLIRTYYKNLLTWLAPPAKRSLVMNNALWRVRWSSPVDELLAVSRTPDLGSLRRLGEAATAVLALDYGRGWVMQQAFDAVAGRFPALASGPMTDIWRGAAPDGAAMVSPDLLPTVAIGGMIEAIGDAYPSTEISEEQFAAVPDRLPGLLQGGLESAVRIAVAEIAGSASRWTGLRLT